jgi:hypothetical protein
MNADEAVIYTLGETMDGVYRNIRKAGNIQLLYCTARVQKVFFTDIQHHLRNQGYTVDEVDHTITMKISWNPVAERGNTRQLIENYEEKRHRMSQPMRAPQSPVKDSIGVQEDNSSCEEYLSVKAPNAPSSVTLPPMVLPSDADKQIRDIIRSSFKDM